MTCTQGRLHVEAGGVLGFETYFNGFFESHWLRYTTIQSLSLQLTLSGSALVRVYRQAIGRKTAIVEQVAGPGTVRLPIALTALNFRQHGFLSVELSACSGEFDFLAGAWITDDVPVRTGLAAVFCTFDREAALGRVLDSIAADEAVQSRLKRIFVVNQGRPGLLAAHAVAEAASRLGSRVRIIEQGNFGGAGGFTRGLLAALADPVITHAVLLDDDIELEPDSLLRMAAFFSFCERDVVVGGHMLDLVQPTMLYEAGARISEREWAFQPQSHMVDVAEPLALEALTEPRAVHYNGWWCCGFPLDVLRQHGLPLPCFIRGDDLELGLRLHQRGVPTVPLPGVAVWHEPFYLKLGSWQLYYETRNMLVAAALNQPSGRLAVARRISRQIVMHLLTYRYYGTALVLEGVRDFLAGPAVFRRPPGLRHATLTALKADYPLAYSRREQVLPEQAPRPPPRGALPCLAVLGWLLLRNAVLRTCADQPRTMRVGDLTWLTVRGLGHVAVETWWDDQVPTYRRTKDQHRVLLRQAAHLFARLLREGPRAAQKWREAAPELTSIGFWQAYLGLPGEPPADECAAAPAAPEPAVAA